MPRTNLEETTNLLAAVNATRALLRDLADLNLDDDLTKLDLLEKDLRLGDPPALPAPQTADEDLLPLELGLDSTLAESRPGPRLVNVLLKHRLARDLAALRLLDRLFTSMDHSRLCGPVA